MKDRKNHEESRSACDTLKNMLETPAVKDNQFGLFHTHGTFTRDTNNLIRAKLACKSGLVESSNSTNQNRLFITKEAYLRKSEVVAIPKEQATPTWFPTV